VDDYLRFVAARARPNTWLAVSYDLKVFFSIVGKEPAAVSTADVFEFIKVQREPRHDGKVIRLDDREKGLAARTVKRRLCSVSGFYAYALALGGYGIVRNPVPRGLAARHPSSKPGRGGVPLIRTPRTLPRILTPPEVLALLDALRTHRDKTMVMAMLFGGLRRSEVLGLQLDDVNAAEHRLFVREGKGGHQRLVSISRRFFEALALYLDGERPRDADQDHVFLVLKRPRLGLPLTASGLDQIVRSARERAGLRAITCHQLRHTCLTRLREAGMSLEAVQAQAGHQSIEATRIYLHLGDSWVYDQYRSAIEALEREVGR
jgi:integrase